MQRRRRHGRSARGLALAAAAAFATALACRGSRSPFAWVKAPVVAVAPAAGAAKELSLSAGEPSSLAGGRANLGSGGPLAGAQGGSSNVRHTSNIALSAIAPAVVVASVAATSSTPAAAGAWFPGGFWLLAAAAVALGLRQIKVWLETPSRPYSAEGSINSVRAEYDTWTREGVLEHYWGEHIHMGSYLPLETQRGYRKDDCFVTAFWRATLGYFTGTYKDFVEAKLDFSREMLEWSGTERPKKILDVGCGIGGTSRFLAKTFPEAEVIGITLSPEQAARAERLAQKAGLTNVWFQVMNALEMTFKDGTFDLVWGCESGEHMPDKKRYVEEMSRVLAPGGHLAVATWCEREPIPPFTTEERRTLKFVYEEWSHPYFISIDAYRALLHDTGGFETVETADWTEQTLPSWRHSIWVGAWSPWHWFKVGLRRPKAFLGFIRDAYTLEIYHRAMCQGLLQYGMMKAVKKS